MSTVTHLSPEEVMALFDGELSASEARVVSSHLDGCAECRELAGQFRSTSESLSRWSVPPIPPAVEEPILQMAAEQAFRRKAAPPLSSWNWIPWTVGFGGIAALLFVLVSILHRAPMTAYMHSSPEMMASHVPDVAARARVNKPVLPAEASADELTLNLLDSAPMPGLTAQQAQRVSSAIDQFEAADVRARLQKSDSSINFAPMIAHTVSLLVRVKDVPASRTALDRLLALHHGYFAQMTLSNQSGNPRNFQASLRIPATELTSTVDDLRTLGIVENESQSGEDVTQQHADLAARLKNNRETEDRLRAILQQRAGSVKDVLQVEEEIARVRGEIERMEAEQTALEHRVDYASVDLHLTEEYVAQLAPAEDSAWTSMHNAFVAGYRHASGTLLGIILFFMEYGPPLLIWLLILGLPIIAVWRYRRRNR